MKSMTGYGKAKFTDENFDLEIEIKSVNSRFLDLKIKNPRELNNFEQFVNKQIGKMIKRGKVEARLSLKDKRNVELTLNEPKLLAYWNVLQKAAQLVGHGDSVSLDRVLEEPNIIETADMALDEDMLKNMIETTLTKALANHKKMADHEGESMRVYSAEAMDRIEAALTHIENEFPAHKEHLYNKLKTNVEELLGRFLAEEDHRRIMMETAVYVEKADITEEVVRLKNHLIKFRNKINAKYGEKGKNLNFILQEMHREINTTGSKFNSDKVLDEVILIKEEIEKVREIIQNVE